MEYAFFKDNSIYEKSKYSLMISYNKDHPFPIPVFIESIEKTKWEHPLFNKEGLLETPPCGNPKVKYFTEEEFNNTFILK